MLHHSLGAPKSLKTGIWSSSATQVRWQLHSPGAAAHVSLLFISLSTELYNPMSPTLSLIKENVKHQPSHSSAA